MQQQRITISILLEELKEELNQLSDSSLETFFQMNYFGLRQQNLIQMKRALLTVATVPAIAQLPLPA
jgi:hypothetical protein